MGKISMVYTLIFLFLTSNSFEISSLKQSRNTRKLHDKRRFAKSFSVSKNSALKSKSVIKMLRSKRTKVVDPLSVLSYMLIAAEYAIKLSTFIVEQVTKKMFSDMESDLNIFYQSISETKQQLAEKMIKLNQNYMNIFLMFLVGIYAHLLKFYQNKNLPVPIVGDYFIMTI